MSKQKKNTLAGVVAGVATSSIVALSVSVPAYAAPGDPVNFEDQNFKNCVATRLAVDPASTITEGQLATITGLSCSNGNITDLTGAEYLTAATTLSLYGNDITDVTPLQGLTALGFLDLSYNDNLADATPVLSLPNLDWLSISSTSVTTLAGAENLTNLRSIYFNDIAVNDLTPLAGLDNLQTIGAYGTEITDLTPLANNDSLTSLTIAESDVADISVLSTFTGPLTTLNLSDTLIDNDDLAVIGDLTDLTALSLLRNDISDVSELSGLTNLVVLDLGNNFYTNGVPEQGNTIADITPLAGLTQLTSLNLSGLEISDVTPLEGLTALEWLYLDGNHITDLTPLVTLTNLNQLSVDRQRTDSSTVATAGEPVPFNVTNVDGATIAPVITPATAGTWDATTRTITYNTAGTFNVSWSAPVVIGTASVNFEGSGGQVVGSVPAAPTNPVAATGAQPGEINVSWDAVTETNGNGDVAGYLVEYRPVGSTAAWANVSSATETTVLTGLTEGTNYEIRVAAVATNNVVGTFSSTVTAVAEAEEGTVPVVTGLTVTNITPTTVTVTWNPVTDTNGNGDVAEYILGIGTGNSGDALTYDADVNTATLQIQPGVEYSVAISYTTTTGVTSGVSSSVTFSSPVIDPAPGIEDFTAKAGEKQGTVDLSWTPISETATGTGGNGDVRDYTFKYRKAGVVEWIVIGTYQGDADLSSGTVENLATGEYEFAISYTTENDVTSAEVYTTAVVTNGVANGANGTGGNGNTGTTPPAVSGDVSGVTPTGVEDNNIWMVGLGLVLVGGVGLVALNAATNRRKLTAN